MFCPKCGSADQTPDSYCRHCGEWLPDIDSRKGGRFRTSTREQKIQRMRILQMVSIGLSLSSALIIVHVFVNGVDQEMLQLAALCGFLVAVYQIITLLLGNKVLTPKSDRHTDAASQVSDAKYSAPSGLKAGDTQDFIIHASVVENTTALLDRVPRSKGKET